MSWITKAENEANKNQIRDKKVEDSKAWIEEKEKEQKTKKKKKKKKEKKKKKKKRERERER